MSGGGDLIACSESSSALQNPRGHQRGPVPVWAIAAEGGLRGLCLDLEVFHGLGPHRVRISNLDRPGAAGFDAGDVNVAVRRFTALPLAAYAERGRRPLSWRLSACAFRDRGRSSMAFIYSVVMAHAASQCPRVARIADIRVRRRSFPFLRVPRQHAAAQRVPRGFRLRGSLLPKELVSALSRFWNLGTPCRQETVDRRSVLRACPSRSSARYALVDARPPASRSPPIFGV